MTSFSTSETTEADVQELIEDALIIRATFQRDAVGRNADVEMIEGLEKSEEVAG